MSITEVFFPSLSYFFVSNPISIIHFFIELTASATSKDAHFSGKYFTPTNALLSHRWNKTVHLNSWLLKRIVVWRLERNIGRFDNSFPMIKQIKKIIADIAVQQISIQSARLETKVYLHFKEWSNIFFWKIITKMLVLEDQSFKVILSNLIRGL